MPAHARTYPRAIVLAIAGVGALAWPAGAATPHPLLETDEEMGCAACARAKITALQDAPAPPPPRTGTDRAANLTDTDVLHYDLDIEIIPSTQSIVGHNTITAQSLVDGLTHFQVRLSSTFAITDLRVGGVPVPWSRPDSVHVDVTLNRAYATGEQFDIFIEYSGTAVGAGFGSIVWTTDPNGAPFVYTLSETWYAYTWWPNKDDNTDKATADLAFTIPDDLFLVSNGVLGSDTPLAGSRRRLQYATAYPAATYLFHFSLADYNTFSGSHTHPGGVMPLEFAIVGTSDSPANRAAWLKTQNMLPVFDDLFGLYPFIDEKYGIYQFGFSGGMEHQTMSGQGTTSESVSAHELAHQWWGDMVTCAQWNDIWLNEGFATYAEALWLEFRNGFDDRTALRNAMSARRPGSFSDSVYVHDASSISRIFSFDFSYLKGAWVLHMLRGVIGDQHFFDTLAAYRAAYEYGASSTPEFQSVAESVSGLDLSTFFTQWVYLPGAPAYRSSFANYAINGQDYAEVYLRQVQNVSYPTYEMPVPLRFTTGAGTHNATVPNHEPDQHFLIPLPAPATTLSLDPDLWILRSSHTTQTHVPGPPKVVESFPAPGALVTAAPLDAITATLHRHVSITGAQATLIGQARGPVSTSFAYDAPSHTLTLTPNDTLPPDTYTLTIDDDVLDAATGVRLDGEVLAGALPSGDGLPGGDASITFVYAPPRLCSGDVDGDDDTDVFDFGAFVAGFGITSGATREQGDLDGNGSVDILDFGILAADFGCP